MFEEKCFYWLIGLGFFHFSYRLDVAAHQTYLIHFNITGVLLRRVHIMTAVDGDHTPLIYQKEWKFVLANCNWHDIKLYPKNDKSWKIAVFPSVIQVKPTPKCTQGQLVIENPPLSCLSSVRCQQWLELWGRSQSSWSTCPSSTLPLLQPPKVEPCPVYFCSSELVF